MLFFCRKTHRRFSYLSSDTAARRPLSHSREADGAEASEDVTIEQKFIARWLRLFIFYLYTYRRKTIIEAVCSSVTKLVETHHCI